MTTPQPAPRWSASTDLDVRAATGGAARLLTDADTPQVAELADADPVANVFVASLLQAGRRTGPRGRTAATCFLGVADPDDGPAAALRAVAWVGSNVVPLAIPGAARHALTLGRAAAALRRRFGSLYGPADQVLGIEAMLASHGHRPRSVRPDQPLMVARGPGTVQPSPTLRQAQPADLDTVLPASAAMFEEELGFSPLRQGAASYRDRVHRLIQAGRVLIEPGEDDGQAPGRMPLFKADLGVLSMDCVQVQGVWVRPDRRGEGLAAPAMAAVVQYAARTADHVSLYVNAYNEPAVRTYARVGFEQVGTFATVLY
ncbi:GNAT family N-acetyltransferase [Micrococcus lylae]|uniref:GNAT family N-acetyltransferase n=1 Tax=Micrococcus lylae TaxID=1273 RepID=UPI0021A5DA78|nr:DUF4081 domain-containing GNAT family N-acetyltransferase [Micrococcus lylae]MCT2007525.1 GNAT family N-acetyltransferase [Micrococcus lylae]MCT2071342.1 GNAT family N-acetyltransferase [Micrococcus lylae]